MSVPTVLTTSRRDRILTWALLPVLGALAGWVVLAWHDVWLAQVWLPMRGPAEVVNRFAAFLGPWAAPVLIGVGVLAGALAALAALDEEVTLSVSGDGVEVATGSSRRRYPTADVREALADGKHLVLVAHNGTDLARVKTGFRRDRLAAAFRDHGVRWTDS